MACLIVKLATRGPSLFSNSNEKLDIVGVWVHPGCWKFVCRHILLRWKKWYASLWNWPPGGQVYIVTQMRNWTLWEFGSPRVLKIGLPPVGCVYLSAEIRNGTFWKFCIPMVKKICLLRIFCQVGKNGTSFFILATRGPHLFWSWNKKLVIWCLKTGALENPNNIFDSSFTCLAVFCLLLYSFLSI